MNGPHWGGGCQIFTLKDIEKNLLKSSGKAFSSKSRDLCYIQYKIHAVGTKPKRKKVLVPKQGKS